MKIECECGNIQEKNVYSNYKIKRINNIKHIKLANEDWKEYKEDTCTKCGKVIQNYSKKDIYNVVASRNIAGSYNFWKNNKSNIELSEILSGDINPY